YAVEVFNNCYSPRAHNAAHVIRHAEGTMTLYLEQDCGLDPYVGQWRPLGSYRFNAGTEGSLTVETAGADNAYVGVTGVRFVYTPSGGGGQNSTPVLTPDQSALTVAGGGPVALGAAADDAEDGDLTPAIVWTSPVGGGEGGAFFATAGTSSFEVTASVTD